MIGTDCTCKSNHHTITNTVASKGNYVLNMIIRWMTGKLHHEITILYLSNLTQWVWRIWRYQRYNQNSEIEEEHTTQWPKQKGQKDKQRSGKHTHKAKDAVTQTPLQVWDELRCPGRVSSSFSTSGTRRINLVTNPVLSREWGKDREEITTSGTYPWSFVTQIFHRG